MVQDWRGIVCLGAGDTFFVLASARLRQELHNEVVPAGAALSLAQLSLIKIGH
jgi:hypothetical protein